MKTANGKTKRAQRLPSHERRTQLLGIARAIILKDGIGALTMEALAEAAGVTKPIVYKHFENSEDVTIAVLREYAQASVEFTIGRLRQTRDLEEFFTEVIDSLFDYVGANGALSRSITSGFSSTPRIDACFLEMRNRALRIYTHLLKRQGIAEGRALLAGYALMEMINSTILEFAKRGDAEDRRTLKDMVLATVNALVGGKGLPPDIPDHLFGTYDLDRHGQTGRAGGPEV